MKIETCIQADQESDREAHELKQVDARAEEDKKEEERKEKDRDHQGKTRGAKPSVPTRQHHKR